MNLLFGRRLRLLALLALSPLTACDRATSQELNFRLSPLSEALTSTAASHVDDRGYFRLPPSPNPGEITPEYAMALADLHVRLFAPGLLPTMERIRRERIDLDDLAPAQRAIFVPTPYVDVPAGLHPGARKGYSSYYVVPIGRNGAPDEPVLVVAVSALNSDIRIDGDILIFPVRRGNDFILDAALPGGVGKLRLSPELAAQYAFSLTGIRVASIPTPTWAGARTSPLHTTWRILLESPAAVRTTSGSLQTVQEIFIGAGGELLIPTEEQPTSVRVSAPTSAPIPRGSLPVMEPIDLEIRPNNPVGFQPVSPENRSWTPESPDLVFGFLSSLR